MTIKSRLAKLEKKRRPGKPLVSVITGDGLHFWDLPSDGIDYRHGLNVDELDPANPPPGAKVYSLAELQGLENETDVIIISYAGQADPLPGAVRVGIDLEKI